MNGHTKYTKVRYYFSVSALYALTLFFAFSAFGLPNTWKGEKQQTIVHAEPRVPKPKKKIIVTSGKPVRILIPRIGIDLPVSDGAFNPADNSWTLSDNQAHFALPSVVPNDYSGNSLIYGHNYGWVFGKLQSLSAGDTMQLFADNGHIFTYVYEGSTALSPDDTSVFTSKGYPTVTVQTCTGRWNEIRQMHRFILEEVNS